MTVSKAEERGIAQDTVAASSELAFVGLHGPLSKRTATLAMGALAVTLSVIGRKLGSVTDADVESSLEAFLAMWRNPPADEGGDAPPEVQAMIDRFGESKRRN